MKIWSESQKERKQSQQNINHCREFLCYFPNETELIHQMRSAIADSYSSLGNFIQAELEFEQLAQDYPDNPRGYFCWGDMYFFDKNDYSRTKVLYEKGMDLVKDEPDMIAFQERLEDIAKKMKGES